MIEHILEHQDAILKALLETLILVGTASLFAILFGMMLGTLLYLSRPSGMRPNRLAYSLANIYVNTIRSFPFLIFIVAMIPVTRFILGKSLGTVAATLPLSLIGIAIYARFVEQSLLDVPYTIIEVSKSLGANLKQSLHYFIFPTARQSMILGLTSSIISLLSYSTVMGVVGGGGIGDFAFRYGYQKFDNTLMYTTVVIMILLVQSIQFIGNSIALKYKGDRND
ncbi:ABC transporter permease [Erysipelothrix sp. HDW6A]|uniref:methionine ABC transporter permease n=1 Tax=Erysipelothrix sp. HDW6A TaxID=2714928 RepID=UPI0014094F07|nr:methionine ABC transporter permease [Erysipelothrix sp. HDW6A]QIK57994.1 ABC transporter permease [Erysipelothrix sp. HDW6A]